MATLALAASGIASGGLGGALLGVGASLVDRVLVNALTPAQKTEGARLDAEAMRVTTATEGKVLPRLFGRMRLAGNVIWATDFTEEAVTARRGGKFAPKVEETNYTYRASFAVALCEGEIGGIGRIWTDGDEIDLTDVTWRWYPGNETQDPDPLIASLTPDTPAFRGTAYVVFEDLALEAFGRRLPQLSFEVFRPLADPDVLEGQVPAVVLGPGTGEFAPATSVVTAEGADAAETLPVNTHARADRSDVLVSLDRLEAQAPMVKAVTLTVPWFGSDLRCGACTLWPGVENAARTTSMPWTVNGVSRAKAWLVSTDADGTPVFGDTPADAAVVEAIQELKARGFRVTFLPTILMDVPPDNTLPSPYSDDAAGIGQPAWPGRGQITCSPAAGFAGTVDRTAAAATQIDAFFGSADWEDFVTEGTEVRWVGGTDRGYRRMVLHYALLCAAAGSVETFLIGSGLRGLTCIRSDATATPSFPAVDQLLALAGDVRVIFPATGPDVEPLTPIAPVASDPYGNVPVNADNGVTFEAEGKVPTGTAFDFDTTLEASFPTVLQDFTIEQFGLTPTLVDTGTSQLVFSAHTLHAPSGNFTDIWIQRIGKDEDGIATGVLGILLNRYRLFGSDAGYATSVSVTMTIPAGTRYLRLKVAVATTSQFRVDEFYALEGTLPQTELGYAADWREYGAYVPGDDEAGSATGSSDPPNGDVFFPLDPLWSSPRIGFVGIDSILPLSDWRDGSVHLDALDPAGWLGAFDLRYLGANVEGGEHFDWVYASDADRATQLRADIVDATYGTPWVFRPKDIRSWWSTAHHDRPGGVESATPTGWVPQSKPIRFTSLGCPAVDRGPNDPGTDDHSVPPFSRGTRNDAVQRACLETIYGHWADPATNPVSSLTGAPMIDLTNAAAASWDLRPHPWFPGLADVWSDAGAWQTGPFLSGRLGSASLRALVRRLCFDAGLTEADIDVSELPDAIEGYVIASIESARDSIAPLARHFAFDVVETGGALRFTLRGRPRAATLTLDDLVSTAPEAEPFELTRGQETELPRVTRWQVARADEDYDAAEVESPEAETTSAVVQSESFPFAAPPEIAFGRVHRAHREAWTEREQAVFALAPSRLALDPGDVVGLSHDGRTLDYRVTGIADTTFRALELRRADRELYDTPAGEPRGVSLSGAPIFGAPLALLLDLPLWQEDQPAQTLWLAAAAAPWPGTLAVWKSVAGGDVTLVTLVERQSTIGSLAANLPPGPTGVLDRSNALEIDLPRDTARSVTDLELFAGANTFAVETASGAWEVVSGQTATLVAPGRYRLAPLLRGLRGTEWAMGAVAGARVVKLDDTLAPVPVALTDLGKTHAWKIGPATLAVDDPALVEIALTPAGIGLGCFSGTQVAPTPKPWSPGDLAIAWKRRDRAPAADNLDPPTIPQSESPEAYEVDILDGTTVKRTLTATSPSAVYTHADQIADWGAPLAAGDSLVLAIYQLSAYVGRGTPLLATLEF